MALSTLSTRLTCRGRIHRRPLCRLPCICQIPSTTRCKCLRSRTAFLPCPTSLCSRCNSLSSKRTHNKTSSKRRRRAILVAPAGSTLHGEAILLVMVRSSAHLHENTKANATQNVFTVASGLMSATGPTVARCSSNGLPSPYTSAHTQARSRTSVRSVPRLVANSSSNVFVHR